MMRTKRFRAGAVAVVGSVSIAFVSACGGGAGSEGQECKKTGTLFNVVYSCDDGLVCNTADQTPTCEKPNTHAVGEPCARDENCKAGLWCDFNVCANPLVASDPCPNGIGCGAGLQCVKSGSTPTCVPVDAGAAD